MLRPNAQRQVCAIFTDFKGCMQFEQVERFDNVFKETVEVTSNATQESTDS